jgi:DNA-binding IclR family transcriptional regulator
MQVNLTESQSIVLAVLAPGGLLTVEQIARDGKLTKYKTRSAVSALKSRGLVAPGRPGSGCYQITGNGARAYNTCGRVARR